MNGQKKECKTVRLNIRVLKERKRVRRAEVCQGKSVKVPREED